MPASLSANHFSWSIQAQILISAPISILSQLLTGWGNMPNGDSLKLGESFSPRAGLRQEAAH
jgi:hypothetical protein